MSRVVGSERASAGTLRAAFARRWLGRQHTLTVVSPRPDYNWVRSNIWVGVGLLKPAKVTFPLAPVYERVGIEFMQAAAREIHPEGERDDPSPYVVVEAADGTRSKVRHDFLINATGTALRLIGARGWGPKAEHRAPHGIFHPEYRARCDRLCPRTSSTGSSAGCRGSRLRS